MKLGAFIKQSLLYLLVMLFVGSAWHLVVSPYKILETELIRQSVILLTGIAVCYGFILNDLCQKYAPLKGNSIPFLSILLVFSTLLAWLMAWSGITEWMMAFIRPLLKSQSLPYYRLVFQWILVSILGFFTFIPLWTSLYFGQWLLVFMGYRSYKKITEN